jgi:hypothetical protein
MIVPMFLVSIPWTDRIAFAGGASRVGFASGLSSNNSWRRQQISQKRKKEGRRTESKAKTKRKVGRRNTIPRDYQGIVVQQG